MTKAELRRQYLTKRRSLTADEVNLRSQAIAQLFFDFLTQLKKTPSSVHCFLPIQRQQEVDTWLIIRQLWALYPAIELAVSVTDVATHQLRHYPLLPDTSLQENRWGIPEPISSDQSAIESHRFDLVLVPLLAFDRKGNRIGYGKGFYDRFLVNCRPDCQKVGLSLFESLEQIDDVEPTDVPLSACITPSGICFFS
ncbi:MULTISPECIES: 5-formyltetrahydrofolate cyclo-ligase [unclassified Spirosoma]|uniref:5-formyltetrahydrofolate cyclo-ligase n=1 Tax=unclassified Spirosoma TaxID=2621999 RepID=UPI000961FBBE|nr:MULTISPECIES: 5-formyltetrahydrofolate cyclo-ligase [unclassified Spirosoma]MBN8822908.1 5-formyltetrahydrofolate cyclo-ligase [Spirosoma sp.]OJW80095.1 MAG: 5-formyltetrahydrofolate cyclo-ligase [Spirosoma sp. 48-14]